jgi:hypothetical protein
VRQRRGSEDDWDPSEWEVTQLRIWGTDVAFALPAAPTRAWTLGAAADNDIVLTDPRQFVSGRHALAVRGDGVWTLRDRESKNGLRINGVRCTDAALVAGDEIRIGGVTLIAESARWIELRELLLRLVGWEPADRAEVDHVQQLIRAGMTRRVPLFLAGPGQRVELAAAIHRGVLGERRPFVVCDPDRPGAPASSRAAANEPSGVRAIAEAAGGTLFLPGPLPPDLADVAKELRSPRCKARLVFRGLAAPHDAPVLVVPIRIPTLAARRHDVDRLVAEYVAEAQVALGGEHGALDAADVASLVRAPWRSVPDLEKGVRRLVAVRAAASMAEAARRLEMSAPALAEWLDRHGLAIRRNG